MKIGYEVKYYSTIVYTYNRALAFKLAQKAQTEVKVVSEEKIKKAIDISI